MLTAFVTVCQGARIAGCASSFSRAAARHNAVGIGFIHEIVRHARSIRLLLPHAEVHLKGHVCGWWLAAVPSPVNIIIAALPIRRHWLAMAGCHYSLLRLRHG